MAEFVRERGATPYTITNGTPEVQTLGTAAVSYGLPDDVVQQNLDAGTIDLTYGPKAVGGFGNVMGILSDQGNDVVMKNTVVNFLNKLVSPTNTTQPPLNNAPATNSH